MSRPISVLITSGGTKVPIDPVRYIGNSSHGNFGSELAMSALVKGCNVTFLKAKHSQTPFTFNSDIMNEGRMPEVYEQKYESYRKYRYNYSQYEFSTYDDYCKMLRSMCSMNCNIVMLAAAVSDYVTDPISCKIRSDNDLCIPLRPAEKVIRNVKSWCDTFLVGFKLLVNSTDEELIRAARLSIAQNGCDLVVANELNTLRNGRHEVLVVSKDCVTKISDSLSTATMKVVLEKYREYINRADGECCDEPCQETDIRF